MTLKAGIIGLGKVGKIRREIIESHPEYDLISIYEPNSEFDSLEKFYSTKLDIVFICTPPKDAEKHTLHTLNQKINVFCEKPPATNSECLKKILELNAQTNTFLSYGFNHRFHDSIIDLISIIESKKFGKILKIEGLYGKTEQTDDWRLNPSKVGGGILMDQGIHLLDIICHLIGYGDVLSSKATYSMENIEDEIEFVINSNGIDAKMISSSKHSKHEFHLNLELENAKLVANGILSSSGSYAPETLELLPNDTSAEGFKRTYNEDNSFKIEIDYMAKSLINNNLGIMDNSKQAYNLICLIEEIYKKAKERT